MKKLMLLIILLLAGCSTIGTNQNLITFYSNPPGATISYGTEVWGIAPVGRVWTLNKGVQHDVSAPITATWVSGATATATLNLEAGKEGAYTFQRPAGVPGLEADVQMGIFRDQQQQLQATKDREFGRKLGKAIGGSRSHTSESTCGYKSDGNYHCGTNCGYKGDGKYHCE